jgi:hypothetical protein
MDFDLKVRKVDDVVIVDFVGNFTIGEPVAAFHDLVRTHLESGASLRNKTDLGLSGLLHFYVYAVLRTYDYWRIVPVIRKLDRKPHLKMSASPIEKVL